MAIDHWNPWHGCHKCSPGCEHCYMYFMDRKRGRAEWSDQVFRTAKFDLPLKKDRKGNYKLRPGWRVMVNMTSDTFLDEARPWMDEFWAIVRKRTDLIFWLLTKRPENIPSMLPKDWGTGYPNVCLNVTVENQEMFDRRWRIFRNIPAEHKGLCCAPLLGSLYVAPALRSGQVECVSAGGENYEGPRPCMYEWFRDLAIQCRSYGTRFCMYECGSLYIRNGRVELWPLKSDQSAVSYFARLSYKGTEPKYVLKDPKTGADVVPPEKRYNVNHCAFCANRMLCNGCLDCGKCGKTSLTDLAGLWAYEDAVMAKGPVPAAAYSGTPTCPAGVGDVSVLDEAWFGA